MKTYDKTDIEVGAMALTERWKWEKVLAIGRRVELLHDKEKQLNKQAAALIKEIMKMPNYKENLKKVRKYYKSQTNKEDK